MACTSSSNEEPNPIPFPINPTLNYYAKNNFDYFLESITPSVPTNTFYLPQDQDRALFYSVESFSLRYLWESYEEWSVYGAGTPFVLGNGDTVVQHYHPTLSAIQLYTIETNSIYFGYHSANPSSPANILANTFDQTLDGEKGYLYLQYNETSSPYDRIPFFEKIMELSWSYPGVLNFESSNLSPSSWMAVAWYPIYPTPGVRNVKEFSSSFVTYHMLSTIQGYGYEIGREYGSGGGGGSRSRTITLSPFATATYKMPAGFGEWVNYWNRVPEVQKILNLQRRAHSWLANQSFAHHDFLFFTSRSDYY